MARAPSFQGAGGKRQAITRRDGTWPLPEEVARELARELAPPAPILSGPVAALREHAAARANRAAPAFPRPPRPARPADLPLALQALWREVLDRHDAMLQLDHFAALEIPYESEGPAVQQAFTRLIGRLHPDKLPRELELLQPYAVRIMARLNVARLALSTRRDREAYLRSLGRPVPPPSPEPAPAAGNVVARVRPERRAFPRSALRRERPSSG